MSAMVGRLPANQSAPSNSRPVMWSSMTRKMARAAFRVAAGASASTSKIACSRASDAGGSRRLAKASHVITSPKAVGSSGSQVPRIVAAGEISEDGFGLVEDEIAVDQNRQFAERVHSEIGRRSLLFAGKDIDRDLGVVEAEKRQEQAHLVAAIVELEVVEGEVVHDRAYAPSSGRPASCGNSRVRRRFSAQAL